VKQLRVDALLPGPPLLHHRAAQPSHFPTNETPSASGYARLHLQTKMDSLHARPPRNLALTGRAFLRVVQGGRHRNQHEYHTGGRSSVCTARAQLSPCIYTQTAPIGSEPI
jgi:hypothetical protein